MKKNQIYYLIIGIILFNFQFVFAISKPRITLTPESGTIYEGGFNGYGKNIAFSYKVENLSSDMFNGTFRPAEVWVYVDGVEVDVVRDYKGLPPYDNGTHRNLTFEKSINYYFSQGTHTIKILAKSYETEVFLLIPYLLVEDEQVTHNIQVTPPPMMTIDNNFTDQGGTTHGLIVTSDHGTQTAPFSFEKNIGQSVTLSAVSPQTNNQNYQMVWNSGSTNKSIWLKNNEWISNSQSFPFTVTAGDNGSTYESQLRKVCNLTFSNPGHTIYLNGSTYNSSVTANVIEQNTISAICPDYSNNGINYTFTGWQDGSTTYGSSITPSSHGNYSAKYLGRPAEVNFWFEGFAQQPIKIVWAANPNPSVQYYIYRQEKINNVYTQPVLLGVVNSGVGYFIDQDYSYTTAKPNAHWLEYSVTTYYPAAGTFSDIGWLTVWGDMYAKIANVDLFNSSLELEVPADYSISNYPNPFNPTTTINYQLPKDGMVTIRVYDIIGKEVATLINEQKSAGYYKVDFDASKLTSGVYIATIQTSGFNKSIKLLLTK